MAAKFKHKWRPTLFKLVLMIVAAQAGARFEEAPEQQAEAKPPTPQGPKPAPSSLKQTTSDTAPARAGAASDEDPLDACYLSNNRASESLTISESTPIGTVVGELLVSFCRAC